MGFITQFKKICFDLLCSQVKSILPLMTTSILVFCSVFGLAQNEKKSSSTIRPWMPQRFMEAVKDASIELIATGNSYGHVADLIIQNNGPTPITIDIPPFEIPPFEHETLSIRGAYQGFFITEVPRVMLKLGEVAVIGVRGRCTRPDLPTPPPGMILPGPDQWTASSEKIPVLQRMVESATSLQSSGKLRTPWSDDPEEELNRVIQLAFWDYVSVTPYDPCAHLKSLWLDNTVEDVDMDEIHRQLRMVADAIILVGQSAGLPDYQPVPIKNPSVARNPQNTCPDLPGQTSSPKSPVFVELIGTGQTTGHIADIKYRNPTKKDYTLRFGSGEPMYIPSNGRDQSYVVPVIPDIPVGPKSSGTVPIHGYCADISKPPVPSGGKFPPVNSWYEACGVNPDPSKNDGKGNADNVIYFSPQKTLPIDQAKDLLIKHHAWPVSARWDCPGLPLDSDILIPGIDKPIKTNLNARDIPNIAIPILLDAFHRITQSMEASYEKGLISTPYSGHRRQEEQILIQQTFWLYSARLEGKNYSFDDLRNKAKEQLEQNTKQSLEQLPENIRAQFNTGITDIWTSIQLVGAEAKVIPNIPAPKSDVSKETSSLSSFPISKIYNYDSNPSSSGLPTSRDPLPVSTNLVPPYSPITQNNPRACTCDTPIKVDLKVENDKTYLFTTELVSLGKGKGRIQKTILDSDKSYTTGDIMRFTLENIHTPCGKCNNSPCQVTNRQIKITTGALENDNSSKAIQTISPFNGTYEVPILPGDKPTGVFITIDYDCTMEGCTPASCSQKFLFKIKNNCMCVPTGSISLKLKSGRRDSLFFTGITSGINIEAAEVKNLEIVGSRNYSVTIDAPRFYNCEGCEGLCRQTGVKYRIFEDTERERRKHQDIIEAGDKKAKEWSEIKDNSTPVKMGKDVKLNDNENKCFILYVKGQCTAVNCGSTPCPDQVYRWCFNTSN